jgi:hypothetical protein
MKYGILCNFYGFPNYLDKVLSSWSDINKNFIFAAACCKFNEYIDINYHLEDTETIKKLNLNYKNIFSYIYSESISNDSIVRNYPLQYLLSQNVDYIWILDGDEFYTEEQIIKITNFVEQEPFIPFFKINFKNFFNDEFHWVDGFCPPRIFKTKLNNLSLDSFYYENDIYYIDRDNNKVDYKQLSNLSIPKAIAHIDHYSWCGEKIYLQNKIKYQNHRYKGICSYKWNEEKDCLDFNDKYYKMINQPNPTIYTI